MANTRIPMSEQTKQKISTSMKNKKKKKMINRTKFDELNGLKNKAKFTYKG